MEKHDEEIMTGQLARLSQVDYEVEEGQPDLLGWTVADSDGNEIGTMEDMLLDVETDDVLFGVVSYGDRTTIVPLELVFMDEEQKQLVLPLVKEDLDQVPEFNTDTEDIQPHVDYWNEKIADWEEGVEEEEEER